LGVKKIEAVAERGYFSGEEIEACDEARITTCLPKPGAANSLAKCLYAKQDFICKPDDDEFECPVGERLIKRTSSEKERMKIYRYSWHLFRCRRHGGAIR